MKMSSDHQDTRGFQPPSAVDELHRQTSSSTTGNNLPVVTTPRLPQTPSPMSPEVEINAPDSPISAAVSHAVFTAPSTSFDGAAPTTTTTTVNTHNLIPQTLTDTNSSANQDLPTTSSPPKSRTSPPGSFTRKQIPQSKLNFFGEKIGQWFWDVIRQSQQHAENDKPPQAKGCVVVEIPQDGCFGFQMNCKCGNRKGMCTEIVSVFCMILIFCFFVIVGIVVSFGLIFSLFFV